VRQMRFPMVGRTGSPGRRTVRNSVRGTLSRERPQINRNPEAGRRSWQVILAGTLDEGGKSY
jgi:hypothetical protein